MLLPYLAALGPPPLRFQSVPPPPDLTVRPAAAAPPVPNPNAAESALAIPPHTDDAPVDSKPATIAATTPPAESPAVAEKNPPIRTKTPPAIIPDDTRPAIRPEDFLPYFQIPGAAKQPGDVNLFVPGSVLGAPAAAPVPPSSATYTQSK